MENKNKEKKKKKNVNPVWKGFKLALKIMSLFILVGILGAGVIFYNKYGKDIFKMQAEAKQLVKSSTIDTFRQTETSLVYDNKKKLISTLKGGEGTKDVYYISYEDIPEHAVDAMISIEDKKFMSHSGVDIKANIRAVLALIKHKGKITQGASTITQQLSRNVFLTQEVTWQRKIKEMFVAMELDKKYSKQQIMEFYLNNIYFANGYYGIQAASKGYFSKNVKELSLSQIVFLCAIPNSPTRYDPADNIDNTIKRRDRILNQMMEDGKITNTQYNDAIREKITLDRKKIKKKNSVETYVYYCAIRALMKERGFEFENNFQDEEEKEEYNERYTDMYNECQQSLYNAGYRIYTSIDMKKQKLLQESIDNELQKFTDQTEEGVYKLQGAGVCIDNKTGRVIAVVGGRSQDLTGYTLNRAYQSYRQPGSAIKPLIVYTPAFEAGYYPERIVLDEKWDGGPRNSNNSYSGNITIRQAVESSKNTIAWKLFEELTPTKGLSYLLNMGFNRISKNDYYPAASLGGFTYGASAVEMAAAFAAIENDGSYREPTCIIKITDSKGEQIVGREISTEPVYGANASRMMTDVMQGVLTRGTAKGYALSNMASAGKTGTTDEKKDGWFIGYTPYYTTSVWVGYDNPQTLYDLMGNTYPLRIWHEFMVKLHEGLENKSFLKYVDTNKSEKEPTPEPTSEPTPEATPEPTPTIEPISTEPVFEPIGDDDPVKDDLGDEPDIDDEDEDIGNDIGNDIGDEIYGDEDTEKEDNNIEDNNTEDNNDNNQDADEDNNINEPEPTQNQDTETSNPQAEPTDTVEDPDQGIEP